MQKAIKKELSFSLDTLERYRAKYGRSASLDTNGTPIAHTDGEPAAPAPPPPSIFTKSLSPPKMTKLQELQQKKEAYLRAKEHEREMEQLQRTERRSIINSSDTPKPKTGSPPSTSPTPNASSSSTAAVATKSSSPAGYTNWSNHHATLCSQSWVAISELMYFCDKYEFTTLSTRDLRTHQEIVAEVRALLSGKAPFDQRTRFPGNIHDPENLWVCIGRCASVEYHLQRIISIFRKPLNQLTPDKQRTVRQNFHLAVSELRLDISARISEVRLYDRLVFEREFRLEWQDEEA
ncbi:uncharacterized protein LOC6612015 [Drosophila sechellia]|uniref:GD22249 n=2 Tax=melanogaster subgroup TaxID=32351 RepID=B4Q9C0_DROSI|nr:uncharacterized protein LOC6612015 [Drosophila sechellia]XP_002078977.1 uncharacterized protein LOC6731842 [Drosophila simulans]EDW52455.1 GM11641 [Drosophila sechellia]EDX04562.1 GD22249 [Drosophila simulans]KMY89566.1 uncharacterized protein Dsimw501_GD22249 [Drosophila simulans]